MSQQLLENPVNAASGPRQVTWTEPEVDTLINYLHVHRSENQGGFKGVTINGALVHLRGLPLQMIGKAKDLKSIRNKWTNVQ